MWCARVVRLVVAQQVLHKQSKQSTPSHGGQGASRLTEQEQRHGEVGRVHLDVAGERLVSKNGVRLFELAPNVSDPAPCCARHPGRQPVALHLERAPIAEFKTERTIIGMYSTPWSSQACMKSGSFPKVQSYAQVAPWARISAAQAVGYYISVTANAYKHVEESCPAHSTAYAILCRSTRTFRNCSLPTLSSSYRPRPRF